VKRFLDPFVAYARTAFRLILADRGMLFGDMVLATIIPFLVQATLWIWLKPEVPGNLTSTKTLFYFAYAIAMGRMNNGYEIIVTTSDRITRGELDTLALRPVSYITQELSSFLGGSVAYALPLCLVFVLHFFTEQKLQNMGFQFACGMIVLLILSIVVCFHLYWILASLCTKLIRADFLATLSVFMAGFLGGELIPMPLMPGWLQELCRLSPFYVMCAALGEALIMADPFLLKQNLILAGIWAIILIPLARLWWKYSFKSYMSAGG
jgi:ABC-2 type transport system permease protein